MNRLISAEWYRARKSAHALRWTFLLIIFFVVIGFFDTYSYVDDITVIKGFGDFFGMFSAMNIYVTVAVGCIFAFSYENKSPYSIFILIFRSSNITYLLFLIYN